jgi:hypothetical protein
VDLTWRRCRYICPATQTESAAAPSEYNKVRYVSLPDSATRRHSTYGPCAMTFTYGSTKDEHAIKGNKVWRVTCNISMLILPKLNTPRCRQEVEDTKFEVFAPSSCFLFALISTLTNPNFTPVQQNPFPPENCDILALAHRSAKTTTYCSQRTPFVRNATSESTRSCFVPDRRDIYLTSDDLKDRFRNQI